MCVAGQVFQKIIVVLAANLAVSMILIWYRLWNLTVVLLKGVHVMLDVHLLFLLISCLTLLLNFLKSFETILVLKTVHNRTPAIGRVF